MNAPADLVVVAARYLINHGYEIVGRNYRGKEGEIDIIAERNNTLHFVHVCIVLSDSVTKLEIDQSALVPESFIDSQTTKRLRRGIDEYVLENEVQRESGHLVSLLYISAKAHMKPSVFFLETLKCDQKSGFFDIFTVLWSLVLVISGRIIVVVFTGRVFCSFNFS